MLSPEYHQIRATLANDGAALDVSLQQQRDEWEAAVAGVTLPPRFAVQRLAERGVAGEWISTAATPEQPVLLFLHGGGYNAGSCRTHRELGAHLCQASAARVLLADYRLAPEHPFPAAVEDAAAAYQWLLAQGIRPAQICVGGDSAGGGLALAALLRLREQGLPLPAAAVLLSPWLDLALAGESIETRAALDPLCSREGLALAAHVYLAGADPRTPLASPLYADLHGLPPLIVQVGDHEMLLSDSTRLADRARAAGVDLTLEVWEGMWHVWHAWAAALPEAQRAIVRVGAFIKQHIVQTTPA